MKSTDWLVRRAGPPRPLRLFCFSYAGGSATVYSSWHDAVGPDVEVCAIQLPGRGARLHEPCVTDMCDLVRELVQVVTAQGETPFVFFGHSLGALLAFEVARYCALLSLPVPQRLILSGCSAPQSRAPARSVNRLSDDELIELLMEYNGTASEVLAHRELMNLLFPSLRADFSLADNYVYRASLKLSIPITVLGGRQDARASEPQVEGWRRETTAECDFHWFDGGHMFINSHGAAVLETVRGALDRQRCA